MQLEGEAYVSYVTVYWGKPRQEPALRLWSRGHGKMLLTDWLKLTLDTSWLPFQEYSLQHQSSKKKMPHRFTTANPMAHLPFSQLRDPSLCQVDIKPVSTGFLSLFCHGFPEHELYVEFYRVWENHCLFSLGYYCYGEIPWPTARWGGKGLCKSLRFQFLGWRDGSAVKSTDWLFWRSQVQFKSQQPHGGSQPSIMKSDALFWSVWRQLQCTYI